MSSLRKLCARILSASRKRTTSRPTCAPWPRTTRRCSASRSWCKSGRSGSAGERDKEHERAYQVRRLGHGSGGAYIEACPVEAVLPFVEILRGHGARRDVVRSRYGLVQRIAPHNVIRRVDYVIVAVVAR